jgi:signal transduction histidine kinase
MLNPMKPVANPPEPVAKNGVTLAQLKHEWAGHHPLLIIPFFRRWEPSLKRDILYTIIFNSLIAAVLVCLSLFVNPTGTWRNFGEIAGKNFLASQVIGFVFYGSFALLGPFLNWLNQQRGIVIYAGYTLFSYVAYIIGANIAARIPGFEGWLRVIWSPGFLTGSFLFAAALSALFYYGWRRRIQELEAEAAIAAATNVQNELKAQIATAELKLLQAQIEPHFLFNTLANVQCLIDTSPRDAKAMLGALNQLLRASLARTRAKETTLAAECELLDRYLTILKIRMGDRLQFAIELPEDLACVAIPPLLLQPIVENAIKHGIEPKVDGGRIEVNIHADSAKIKIVVSDTGMGFTHAAGAAPTSGTGLGLANIRARLAHTYGEAAVLAILSPDTGGTRVELTLPLTTTLPAPVSVPPIRSSEARQTSPRLAA